MWSDKAGWYEAICDTVVGTAINFPLNVLLLYTASSMNMTILGTAVFITASLFILAVLRKYIIRQKFQKK